MNEIRTVIAAANIADKQNDYFTAKSLKRLEGENLSLPVEVDFDPTKIIGKIKELEFRHGMLIATIELEKKDFKLKDKIFRICGKINSAKKQKGINVIDDLNILGAGMIDKERDAYPLDLKEDLKIT